MTENARFTFIDLFAGIGGMRLAFESVGGRCVFSSEWDRFAQQTYAANFGDTPEGDITEIASDTIPDHDVLIGGFPCQPFSHAGYRLGFEDTRGTLFFEIARIVNDRRPQMILLENVKGFRNHDGGNTFRAVCNTLSDLGYEVHSELLDARDFGVPQRRERVFIVGIRADVLGAQSFSFPPGRNRAQRLGDILEPAPDERYTISDRLWHGHLRRREAHLLRGNGFGYTLFNADSPHARTISARYYKDGSEILIEQPGKNPRKITPREAARLQGFPDDFVIPVSNGQAYKQFGNSVAVPVVQAVAEAMVPYLVDGSGHTNVV